MVGASERPDSFGWRMTTEVLRSPGVERAWLVNPARSEVLGQPCLPTLADVPEPVGPGAARRRRPRPGRPCADRVRPRRRRRGRVRRRARPPRRAGLRRRRAGALRRRVHGLRQRGPRRPGDRLPRARPGAGRPDRAGHPLRLGVLGDAPHPPPPGVLPGRVLRAGAGHHRPPTISPTRCRCPRPASSAWCSRRCGTRARMRAVLADAAARDVPVVALTVGTSSRGRSLVDAHSGAIAGSDAAWEALFAAYGVHRVDDLGELADSLECFAVGRRVRRRRRRDRDRARLRGRAGARRRPGRAPRRPVRTAVGGHDRAPGRRSSTRGSSRRTRSTCGAPARTPRARWPTA